MESDVESDDGNPEKENSEIEDETSQEDFVIEALEEFLEQDPLCDTTNFSSIQETSYSKQPKRRKKLDVELNTIRLDLGVAGSSQFVLQTVFFKRRFVGESSGSQIATKIITGKCVNDILRGIWEVVQPILHREIVFVENNGTQIPTWADSEPVFEEMNKFLILQDHQHKKRVTIDKVDSKLLVIWRNRDIRVHVHVYSRSVSSKSMWDLADKQLIRFQNADRSGAPNNQSLTSLAQELQDLHGNHFSGHSSAWRLWANYVHSASAHERERRKSELPPIYLLKFFRSAPISEAVRLQTTQSGLSVASTINDGFSADLKEIAADVEQLVALGQRLKQRIEGLCSRSAINSSLVSAMRESVHPEENELSHTLADRVTDMEDRDHV